MPQVICLLSIARFSLSVISKIACSVEWPFLNPNWYSHKMLYLSKKDCNWLYMIRSRTLVKGDNIESGL